VEFLLTTCNLQIFGFNISQQSNSDAAQYLLSPSSWTVLVVVEVSIQLSGISFGAHLAASMLAVKIRSSRAVGLSFWSSFTRLLEIE
jgi:hypothetical protein